MEKAILKTLIYADIFNYPLKGHEIHKWLIGEEASLPQVEKALTRLLNKRKIETFRGYYFLPHKKNLILKRKTRGIQSIKYLKKAKLLSLSLKLIPSIKLVGISGGLAVNNASKTDDLDLFIITSKDRLWLCRMLAIVILDLLGVRRKAKMKLPQTSGKLCLNILLEEDKSEQERKDIYVAHEVLQMKVLWEREGVYQKYLEGNSWAFRFLPNWTTSQRLMIIRPSFGGKDLRLKDKQSLKLLDIFEKFAKWLQLKIMRKPQGMERIEDGALYFHPQDYRGKVLQRYRLKIKKL